MERLSRRPERVHPALARPAARSAASPQQDARGDAGVRGGGLRRRDRRDGRRRPERDRGRRHDRHVRAAAAAERRRRPAGDQEGRDRAGRHGRRSTRPTSTAAAATRAQAQITSALRLLRPHGSRAKRAAPALWRRRSSAERAERRRASTRSGDAVRALPRRADRAAARSPARRQRQALAWMWERIDAGLHAALPRSTPRCSERCCARRGDWPTVDAGRGCAVVERRATDAAASFAATRLSPGDEGLEENAMHDIIEQLEEKRGAGAARRRREAHRRAARARAS